MRVAHFVTIEKVDSVILFLESYLEHYAEAIQTSSAKFSTVIANTDADECLRRQLQQKKLREILNIQERERHADHLQPRKCLFCSIVCDSKYKLFDHMFAIHGFNCGLLDNLVEVEAFLRLVEAKLVALKCIYCEKDFTSAAVLRKHMRKKKHFKIHPKNPLYDRFYVINFVEPGKNWQTLAQEDTDAGRTMRNSLAACEASDEDADRFDDGSNDDDLCADQQTPCLFDADVFDCAQDALRHLSQAHGFDLARLILQETLDFYDVIKVINWMRLCWCHVQCAFCSQSFEDPILLTAHLNAHIAANALPSRHLWDCDAHMTPVYPNDPLIIAADDFFLSEPV